MFGLRYLSVVALIILWPLSILGCQVERDRSMLDKEELNKYIVVPSSTKSVVFELVTLPENKRDDVPGPTDYVSLIAVINLAKPLESGKLNEMEPGYFSGFPETFIREWMSASVKESFRSVSSVSDNLRYLDAKKIVRGNVKRAVGVYPNDKTLLLYVEYVSPMN